MNLVVIATELLRLIEKIPPTFWGVVTGSFFSLGGVVLTNRASDKRLRAQLAHERELRNRERELALRKDIYLTAADAISAGLIAVSQFSNLDIPNEKLIEKYIEKSSAITKVHVTAKEETIKSITILTEELNATYMKLFAKRIPLIMQKQRLAFFQNQIDAFSAERDRMLHLMRQFNIEGLTDQNRFNTIKNNFDFELKRIDELIAKRDQLAIDFGMKQLAYARECITESSRLSRFLMPLLISVRRELDLPINEAVYRQIIDESVSKREDYLTEFFKSVQSFMVPPNSV